MNELLIAAVVCVVTIVVMEGVAWTMHRYLMHGPLWFIHRSHHERRTGLFELNDVFGIFFAVTSMALIHFGRLGEPVLLGLGIGLLGYGIIYFMLHDVLVHRRVPHRFTPTGGYLSRIVTAHHLHHVTHERDGAVSFGFVIAPPAERLRRMLAVQRAGGASGAA